MTRYDRKKFFDALRSKVNLTTENVYGMEKILGYAEEFYSAMVLQRLAYIMATVWWETGGRMSPIVEYGSAEYLRSKSYWPYIGRGLVQLTWKSNYEKMGKKLGADFVKKPELLLDWVYALPILFMGMQQGLFTGKDLGAFIDEEDDLDDDELKEYVAARRVVNGTDKALSIARLALHFEHALSVAAKLLSEPESSGPVTSVPSGPGEVVYVELPQSSPSLFWVVLSWLITIGFGIALAVRSIL